MRERGRERVPASRAETAVRARVDEPAGPVRVDVLPRVRHEVATVANNDRVAVEAAAELAVDARWPDRRRVGLQVVHLAGPARVLLFA
jgi:hypothetical protein